jgi:hypothetical protein
MSLYQYNDQPITKKLNEQAKHKSIGREQSSKSLFPQITPPSESQQVGVIRQKSPPPASNLVLTEDSQKARSKKKNSTEEIAKQNLTFLCQRQNTSWN